MPPVFSISTVRSPRKGHCPRVEAATSGDVPAGLATAPGHARRVRRSSPAFASASSRLRRSAWVSRMKGWSSSTGQPSRCQGFFVSRPYKYKHTLHARCQSTQAEWERYDRRHRTAPASLMRTWRSLTSDDTALEVNRVNILWAACAVSSACLEAASAGGVAWKVHWRMWSAGNVPGGRI